MKRLPDDDIDPPRWRDGPGPEGTAAEGETPSTDAIGLVVRALPDPADLDDVRLAHIKQRVTRAGGARFAASRMPGRSWLRTVAFAAGFVCVGGIATAMAARIYIGRMERLSAAAPAAQDGSAARATGRGKTRRWRMAVKEPADLELSFGSNGAEIDVVVGKAEITGGQTAAPVLLAPGDSWREGGPAVQKAAPSAGGPPARAAAPPPADRPVALPAPAPVPAPAPALAPAPARVGPPAPVARAVVAIVSGAPHAPKARRAVAADVAAVAEALPSAPAAPPPAVAGAPPAVQLYPPAFAAPQPRSWGTTGGTAAVTGPVPATSPGGERAAETGEAALLAGALRILRIHGAAQEALARLDEHDRRFPRGVLGKEARLARVEALLSLGRKDAALQVLDALPLASRGPDRRLALTRAELRSGGGHCADALPELDRLLSAMADDEVAGEALLARSRCHARSGSADRARADLRNYLRRFPDGSHRPAAEALLRKLGD